MRQEKEGKSLIKKKDFLHFEQELSLPLQEK